MVIMARGIARGRIRTTAPTTEESLNVAAVIQIIAWHRRAALVYCLDIHVMTNWHLSKQGIRWPVLHD